MADITLPGSFTDGSAAAVATFNDRLYKPGTPATSFAEVNGLLERANFNASYAAESEAIQRRQMSRGGTIGRTIDIDLPRALFGPDGTASRAYVPIPGCGLSFYVPKANTPVMLTWGFCATHDSNDSADNVEFKLVLDGTALANTLRAIPQTWETTTPMWRLQFAPRTFAGHRFTSGLSKGWHEAYIGVYSEANLTRIMVSRFSWLWFL